MARRQRMPELLLSAASLRLAVSALPVVLALAVLLAVESPRLLREPV
ncbi:hypothetical protein NSU18_25740 [Paenibacillus sp. FSL H8-0048]